jgi:hypothetical protein
MLTLNTVDVTNGSIDYLTRYKSKRDPRIEKLYNFLKENSAQSVPDVEKIYLLKKYEI